MKSFDDQRARTVRRLALAAAMTTITAFGMSSTAAAATTSATASCGAKYPSASTLIPVRFKSHFGDMNVLATTCVVGQKRAEQKARVVVKWQPASTALGKVTAARPRRFVLFMMSIVLENGHGRRDGRIGRAGDPSSLVYNSCLPREPENANLMVGSDINVKPSGSASCDTPAGQFITSPKYVSADGQISYAFSPSPGTAPSWQLKGSPLVPSLN